MSRPTTRYWHGGAPDLRPGDLIEPRAHDDTRHLVDGCPICEARHNGEQRDDDDNDPTRVYVTTDREYARLYAAGYPNGALYQVEPIGEMVDRTGEHDPAPSWGVPAARVRVVYDPCVRPTKGQIRRMQRRWLT